MNLYVRPTFISTEVEPPHPPPPIRTGGFGFTQSNFNVSPSQASLGVKRATRALLYVIICLVGSYFGGGSEGLSLWADPKYIRAAKGGNGDCKLGGWVKAFTH